MSTTRTPYITFKVFILRSCVGSKPKGSLETVCLNLKISDSFAPLRKDFSSSLTQIHVKTFLHPSYSYLALQNIYVMSKGRQNL